MGHGADFQGAGAGTAHSPGLRKASPRLQEVLPVGRGSGQGPASRLRLRGCQPCFLLLSAVNDNSCRTLQEKPSLDSVAQSRAGVHRRPPQVQPRPPKLRDLRVFSAGCEFRSSPGLPPGGRPPAVTVPQVELRGCRRRRWRRLSLLVVVISRPGVPASAPSWRLHTPAQFTRL